MLALGLWNLFNFLFIGGALTAIDPDELDNARAMGIGTGIGSVLAPLIAMFIGGLVAGRLASHYDRKVAAGHGALVWAITSVVGLTIMASVAGNFFDKGASAAHANMAASAPAPGTADYIDDQVRLINQHLKSQSAPTIETEDFLDASRYAAGDGKGVNKVAFVSRLDANTELSRPEAESVIAFMGEGSPDVIVSAQQLALHRHQAMEAAEKTGNGMLGAGVGLFLCLATAVGGALIGSRLLDKRNRNHDRPDTIPGQPVTHTTAPYPTTSPVVETNPNLRRDRNE
ncbi:MAG: hypothetical protein H0T65_14495 [Deltaproteobacteria bacterium]|nr:hypothetical protein [Deltaproteobacteria bacterium]